MAKQITISIDDWVYESIEKLRSEKNRGRSELANELLSKALILRGN